MRNKIKLISIYLLVLLFISICASFSFAADYPDRVVKNIVCFSAGGGTDLMSRTFAPHLSKALGVDVVVENHPGAGSQVGATYLLNSEPDGYQYATATQPHLSFTIFSQKAPYVLDDFAYINVGHVDPLALSVLNESPWQDINEFFDYIRENPGEIAIGVSRASGNHIVSLYLQEEYELDFIIVPYSGGGEGRAALLGGHVDAYFDNAFAGSSLADQTRCLGIGWHERSPLRPDAPTFKESLNDDKLNDLSISMAAARSLIVQKEFKDKYPDRWEILVQAVKKAWLSEEHIEAAKKAGRMDSIMHWFGPEESQQMAESTYLIVEQYAHYFD